MRRPARLYATDLKGGIPRMSWAPENLYNIILRTTVPRQRSAITLTQVSSTMYQQRWTAKKYVRGYHGEWIQEHSFRRWFLPNIVPRLEPMRIPRVGSDETRGAGMLDGEDATEPVPVMSLMVRDVERRLDTVVHRCCFARSAREGKFLVVEGHVKVNGVTQRVSGTLLNPGDLVSVDPNMIAMLSRKTAETVIRRKKASSNLGPYASQGGAAEAETGEEAAAVEEADEGSAEATEEATEEAVKASEAKSEEASEAKSENASEAKSEEASEAKSEEASEAKSEEASEAKSEEASEAKSEDDATTAKSARAAKGSEKAEKKSKAEMHARNHAQVLKEEKQLRDLPKGVLPFTLPRFAAPHIFVPPYLEVSFTTCSAIYVRHPTITAAPPQRRPLRAGEKPVLYRSDIPSPYPPESPLFSLAWEYYSRNSPRTRGDVRRLRDEGRVGRNGFATARAKERWRKLIAIRRGKVKVETDAAHTVEPQPPVMRPHSARRRQGRFSRGFKLAIGGARLRREVTGEKLRRPKHFAPRKTRRT